MSGSGTMSDTSGMNGGGSRNGNSRGSGRGSGRPRRVQVNVVRTTPAPQRRHRRTLIVFSIAAAIILVSALIGYRIYASQTSGSYQVPAHASDGAAGIVAAGSGKIKVEVYVDFHCPTCKVFEQSASATLDDLVARNEITLIYHPVAFLDRMSTTQYSTRAAASAGCASDLNRFLPYTRALFAQQPSGSSAGLSDDQLIQIGGQVGMINPRFARCVRDGTYRTWVAHVTDAADQRGAAGTPTVLVNGTSIATPGTVPTVADLTAAVGAAR